MVWPNTAQVMTNSAMQTASFTRRELAETIPGGLRCALDALIRDHSVKNRFIAGGSSSRHASKKLSELSIHLFYFWCFQHVQNLARDKNFPIAATRHLFK